ncbi:MULTISPECIES: hypothetical protein [unclassified Caulobacter]|uniref:hypothetical protein n=1 Tax=unclassified Caulobacter TaxID=2648921 RepID=UPI0012E33641|nr:MULTISPECIES: hypothetical protein [unclassified Caulobacter]
MAKFLSGQLSGVWGGPFSEYAVLLLVWATLIGWQLKPLWDHSLEAWEVRRGDFVPGSRRFNAFTRWLAQRSLADRQAIAWNARLKMGLTPAEHHTFRDWRRSPSKRAGLRRQTYGTSPWIFWILTAALSATVASYAYHVMTSQ